MAPPSRLADGSSLLVADTSALINLNATGCADKILRAVPNRLVAVDTVMAELNAGLQTGRTDAEAVTALVTVGLIDLVSLDEHGLELFERLVVGPAVDTLDDGEAATLAYAALSGGTAIIDEQKATRIGGQTLGSVGLITTVDLLAHSAVQATLGRDGLAEAVHSALSQARMRVFERNVPWVIDLIGRDRAMSCASLSRVARRAAERSPTA